MTRVFAYSKVAGSVVGIAAALFAAGGLAGQSSEVLVDHDRVTEQRTNMPPREGPLQPIQVQVSREGCPGSVDLAACVHMNMRSVGEAGKIVGTASSAPATVRAGGNDVDTFGRK
jgi:hypothetical protein